MPQIKTTLAREELVSSGDSKTTVWPFVVSLFVLGFLWFEVVRHLKGEWSFNPQYGYGWSVPFLALYLLWKRWLERPLPAPPHSRFLSIGLILVCAFLVFPIRFVAEANPDWRLLSWAFALIAVTISLAAVFLAGGHPWLRYFGFPFLFFLVAVPWPVQLEQFVIQNLMRAVTAINVSGLNLAGIPALQHGNVIEVGSGFIGIEEACSGVRSLQATLMISLFLGELYSFTIARRIFLVIAGGVLAFICNLLRTATLVWLGAHRGASAIEAWHDPAGLSILLVCLFGLWSLSLLLRRRSPPQIISAPFENKFAPVRFPVPLLVTLAVWCLFVEAGVQLWYRVHESPMAKLRWGVRWPSAENGYKAVTIAPETESLLRYNEGGGATWDGSDGHQWMMYFFRWLPGRTAALFVKIHRPDICLPASGLTMVSDNGIRFVNINGINLPVRSYRFDDHGAPLHVFYCYFDARSSYENETAANEEDWTARGRVRAALRGQRELGALMLEVVVWGYENDAEANSALQRQLAETVRPG
jgi:exosortase